jgi:uncharacterized BrkB/YihY/UPF0761 family membrane protein
MDKTTAGLIVGGLFALLWMLWAIDKRLERIINLLWDIKQGRRDTDL